MIDFDDVIARKQAGLFDGVKTVAYVSENNFVSLFDVTFDPFDPHLKYVGDKFSAILADGSLWSCKSSRNILPILVQAYEDGCLFVNNATIDGRSRLYDLRDFTVDELIKLRDSVAKVALSEFKEQDDEPELFDLGYRKRSGKLWADSTISDFLVGKEVRDKPYWD